MCSTFNVKCSWDGLLGERNYFCVWSFWCSELCRVVQTVKVQRGSVLDVRGPEWFCQPFCSLWISTVLGEWGGLYQWFAQQSGLPSVVFWGQIWWLSWTRQLLTCRGRIQWWLSRTVSAAPDRLNFLSWRRKCSLCWAFFTIDSMWLSHFRSWEIVAPRNLNESTAVTVLFMMVIAGRAGFWAC